MGRTDSEEFDFDVEWERSLKESPVREVEVEKSTPDLSLTTIIDRFVSLAGKSLEQGKVKKEDYDNLVAQAGEIKKVLVKVKQSDLIASEMKERSKKIEKDLRDRITRLIQ